MKPSKDSKPFEGFIFGHKKKVIRMNNLFMSSESLTLNDLREPVYQC